MDYSDDVREYLDWYLLHLNGSTNHYRCVLAYSGAVMGNIESVDKFLAAYQEEVLDNHNDPYGIVAVE